MPTTRTNRDGSEVSQLVYSREVPVGDPVDVVVVGGGIAGVCAACAASRAGCRVVLVERFATLGGNGTTGGVRGFCGETSGQGAIFDEILADLDAFSALAPYFPQKKVLFRARRYDHAILALVLQELALRHGVSLLLHTRFVDARREGNRVTHVLVAGKSHPLEAFPAQVVVDCTGEADLCRAAGFPVSKGRPSDGLQLPMSLNFFVRRGSRRKSNHEVPAGYFPWTPYTRREQLPMTSFGPVGPRGKSVKIKVPEYDATDTRALTAAEVAGRRTMMRVLDFFQQVKGKRWQLDHCAPIIGIREGRRVVGEYTLTVADLRAARTFPDAIAVGTFPLDAHKPDDDKRTYVLSRDAIRVPPYQIPLRCLVPRGAENVLVAGRDISADQLALSSARVMTTCAMTGQAAGVTAALACEMEKNARVIALEHPDRVREVLEHHGARVDLGYYR